MRRNKFLKWQFYATAAEELMAYIDEDEAENILNPTAYSVQGHVPHPITKEFLGKKYPHCMLCSMEEAIIHKCMQLSRTDCKNIKLARRKQYLLF